MSVIGNSPNPNDISVFKTVNKQSITGTGASSYNLSYDASVPEELEVFVNNVRQEPRVSYNIASGQITFSEAIASTDDCYIIFQGSRVGTVAHPSNQALAATTGTFSGALSGTTGTFSGALSGTTGTFTGNVYAPGHVVQVVESSSNTTRSTSSTNPISLIDLAITPLQSTSKMILMASTPLQVSVGSSNAYASCYIYDPGGNQLARSVTGQAAYNSDQHALFAVHSPGSTSSQTYSFKMGSSSGGTGTVTTDGQPYNFIIMEIAQ